MSTAITRQGGGFSIAPSNMNELIDFAKLLANSDLVPKDYRDKPGNCMVAIQMGGELGLSPMQSIQNISVINGRPSLWGDALLAVCLPHLDAFDETDDGATATCVAKRGNRTVTTTFSTEDAKRAGLAGKQGPWSQYPARMRKMRARSFTLRDICADVLRGIHSAEETQDLPEVRAEVVERPKPSADAPKQLSEPKQERKSSPPPAAEPPTFALTFPNKNYAGNTLASCDDLEILKDYKCWLEAQLNDPRKRRKAEVALEVLADEFARRIELEAVAKADSTDAIADGLQKVIDDRESAPGGEYDTKPSWGLEP
jgi:hypothetical protein